MAIGSSLGINLPTQGVTTNWGSTLNTELQKIIDAVEASVPASAISVAADLDFGNYALTSVAHATFDQQSSAPTELNSVYFDSAGELTIRDGANNVVTITSSGGLSGAGGSITDTGGTYGTSGIALDWDGTNYTFKNGSGANAYAPVILDTLQIRDGSGNAITLDCPSISSNYTVTFPTAVPAAAAFLQSDTSGNITFSNTMSQDITLGSGAYYKHGDFVMSIPATAGQSEGNNADAGEVWWVASNSTVGAVTPTATGLSTSYSALHIPIPMQQGKKITNVDMHVDNGTSACTVYASLKVITMTTGATAATVQTANTGSTTGDNTISLTTDSSALGASQMFVLYVYVSGTYDANLELHGAEVTYAHA